MADGYGALYLHVPFCKQRCGYCDFTTRAIESDSPKLDDYRDRLVREIRAASREGLLGSVETIYIGGGTPTYLGHRRLVDLAYTLSLSINLHPTTEFSIEGNPESVTVAMIRDLYSLGVNRFSLGVQSFNDTELKTLGRAHDAAMAQRAIEAIRERFENISIDLMCGIPGQDLRSWETTLQTAIELNIDHISVYPLTIESGTPFAAKIASGRLSVPDDDQEALMMETASLMLQRGGYDRYEVASYARPGFECRHNISYWTGVPYLGLGEGAAGMHNTPTGRERLQDGIVIERLDGAQTLAEDLMLGMRMSQGVTVDKVKSAQTLISGMQDIFDDLVVLGLVEIIDGRYRPTERGWLLGNELYGRIWAAVSSEPIN